MAQTLKPVCWVCHRTMTCLDEENQRWYCYQDDQLFYAKDQYWVEPQARPVFINLMSRKSKVRLLFVNCILISTMALSYGLSAVIFSLVRSMNVLMGLITVMAPPCLGLAVFIYGYYTIPKKERNKSYEPIWDGVFRHPVDKTLVALFVWWIVGVISYMAIITYKYFRGL